MKGLHSRYMVAIDFLTYKGYETGDIQMKWNTDYNIFSAEHREKKALKKEGLDRDYTPEEMHKKFYDLCTDFGLTKEGKIIPGDKTLLCDDF